MAQKRKQKQKIHDNYTLSSIRVSISENLMAQKRKQKIHDQLHVTLLNISFENKNNVISSLMICYFNIFV